MSKLASIFSFLGILFWPLLSMAQDNIQMELFRKVNLYNHAYLYRDCDNKINFNFSQNGNSLIINELNFEAINGNVKMINPQELILRPNEAGEMTLIAKKGDKEINRFTFKVMPIPPPKIFLAKTDDNNSKALDIRNPIFVPEKLYIIAQPEPQFAGALPKESIYEVLEISVTVFDKGRAVSQATFTSGELDMTKLKATPGSGIQITVQKVQRKKSDGTQENAPIETPYIGFFVK